MSTKERIEELKFMQKQRQRTQGIDVHSLAIGEASDRSKLSASQAAAAAASAIENDPWRVKTGGLVDMRVVMEKRGNDIVKNMHSNFARETNQRDEDAEMQKFIEEQVRLKKAGEARAATALALAAEPKATSTTTSSSSSALSSGMQLPEQAVLAHLKGESSGLPQNDSDLSSATTVLKTTTKKKYKSPDEALFDVPKFLIESASKQKTVELLSDQMLSGIPEVELGVNERMRNIETTERARQTLIANRRRIQGQGQRQGQEQKHEDQESSAPNVRFSINAYSKRTQQQSEKDSEKARQEHHDKKKNEEAAAETDANEKLPSSAVVDGNSAYAPQNTAMNFVQHKRFDDALINPDHMIRPRMPGQKNNRGSEGGGGHGSGGGGGGGYQQQQQQQQQNQQPVVGDAPKHEILIAAQLQAQHEANKAHSFRNNRRGGRGGGAPHHGRGRRQNFSSTNANEHDEQHEKQREEQLEKAKAKAKASASASASETGTGTGTGSSSDKSTTDGSARNSSTSKRSSTNSNATERASDDYCLDRFRKNMRFSRSSKIKIA